LRILLVTFDPPTGSGGIEGRTMAYTAGLLGRSIHVEVAALSAGRGESEEPYLGTRLVRLSSSILKLPKTFGALVKMMSQSSLDTIFMLSGGSTPLGILVLGYSRLTGRRAALFFYGRDILQTIRRPVGRIFVVLSILLSEGVATNSKYTASLLPYRPGSHLTILYPGVDANISSGLPPPENHRRPFRILFVGRLVPRKGADILITAFNQLKSRHPSLRLDIVGDGPEAEKLRALADSLGLGDAVEFHGALYGPSLWRRYAESSLFVMPSRESAYETEGFGTVFLEAGVFGVPSVGTRMGGIPEAVIDGVTGKLVDCEDVVGLERILEALLESPSEMARLGRNARQRALELSWEASTNGLLRTLGQEAL
jgi:phosphatidylinositol alpha-1,6-mannosyltransferase